MAESRDGIHISGGAFSAGNVAVGKGATVNSTQGLQGGDLATAAAHLLAVLRQHQATIADGDTLVERAEALEQEARTPRPNLMRLRELLGGIAAAGASVEGVAEALDAVRTLL